MQCKRPSLGQLGLHDVNKACAVNNRCRHTGNFAELNGFNQLKPDLIATHDMMHTEWFISIEHLLLLIQHLEGLLAMKPIHEHNFKTRAQNLRPPHAKSMVILMRARKLGRLFAVQFMNIAQGIRRIHNLVQLDIDLLKIVMIEIQKLHGGLLNPGPRERRICAWFTLPIRAIHYVLNGFIVCELHSRGMKSIKGFRNQREMKRR